MQSSSTIPRNFANVNLQASYSGSCFDFSDFVSFAAHNHVDDFELDLEECLSTTPCSETGDVDHDAILHLTCSGSTSASASTKSLNTPRSGPMNRIEQDDIIDRVIKRLQGYSIAQDRSIADTDAARKISRSGMIGARPIVVSEQDSMMWTKVWGSATAVRHAKERRARRTARKNAIRVVNDGL